LEAPSVEGVDGIVRFRGQGRTGTKQTCVASPTLRLLGLFALSQVFAGKPFSTFPKPA
jgi:hypothetical protein